MVAVPPYNSSSLAGCETFWEIWTLLCSLQLEVAFHIELSWWIFLQSLLTSTRQATSILWVIVRSRSLSIFNVSLHLFSLTKPIPFTLCKSILVHFPLRLYKTSPWWPLSSRLSWPRLWLDSKIGRSSRDRGPRGQATRVVSRHWNHQWRVVLDVWGSANSCKA